MADFLGLSRSAYSTYETGRNEPSLDTLRIIAEKLEVSVDYLLGLTDDPKETIDIGTFAASSEIPLDQLTDEQREEIRNFILFQLSKNGKE